MLETNYDEINNITTVKLDDPGAYSAFKMGIDSGNTRHWDRHPDSFELKGVIGANMSHSQIVIQHGDSFLPLKMR
jgi:hypothetical protein